MIATDTQFERLKGLVKRYRVCWRVWPETVYDSRAKHEEKIGFDLELIGTHAPGVEHATPGCPDCREVFAALVDIAEWIMPQEERPTRYDIDPYERAIRYSPSRDFRPDVVLTIRILHREDGLRPVDECEIRCRDEMKRKLLSLGASEGQWIGAREEIRAATS